MKKREKTEEDKKKTYHRRTSYSYNYRLTLPGEVDESKIDAIYVDGVMKVIFPKAEKSQVKKIPVKQQL